MAGACPLGTGSGDLPLVAHPVLPMNGPAARPPTPTVQEPREETKPTPKTRNVEHKKSRVFGLFTKDSWPCKKKSKTQKESVKKKVIKTEAPNAQTVADIEEKERRRRRASRSAGGDSQPLRCPRSCGLPYLRMILAATENAWLNAQSSRFVVDEPPVLTVNDDHNVVKVLQDRAIYKKNFSKRAEVYTQDDWAPACGRGALQWRGRLQELCHCPAWPCVCCPTGDSKEGTQVEKTVPMPADQGPCVWGMLQTRLDTELCNEYSPSPPQGGRVARFCLGLGRCFHAAPPPPPCDSRATPPPCGMEPPPLPCTDTVEPTPCSCLAVNKQRKKEAKKDITMDNKPEKPKKKKIKKKKVKPPKKVRPEVLAQQQRQQKREESRKLAQAASLNPKPAAPELVDMLIDRNWVYLQSLRFLDPPSEPIKKKNIITPKKISDRMRKKAKKKWCSRARAETFALEESGRKLGSLQWEAAKRADLLAPVYCACPTKPCRCQRRALPRSRALPDGRPNQYVTEPDMKRQWRNWLQMLETETTKEPPVPTDPQLEMDTNPVSCTSVQTCVRHGSRPPGYGVRSVCVPTCSRSCVVAGSHTPLPASAAKPAGAANTPGPAGAAPAMDSQQPSTTPPPQDQRKPKVKHCEDQEEGDGANDSKKRKLTWATWVCYQTSQEWDLPLEARTAVKTPCGIDAGDSMPISSEAHRSDGVQGPAEYDCYVNNNLGPVVTAPWPRDTCVATALLPPTRRDSKEPQKAQKPPPLQMLTPRRRCRHEPLWSENLYWFFRDRRTTYTQTGEKQHEGREMAPRDCSCVLTPPPLKRLIEQTGLRFWNAKQSVLNWIYDLEDNVKSVEIQCDIPYMEDNDQCQCMQMLNFEQRDKCMNKKKPPELQKLLRDTQDEPMKSSSPPSKAAEGMKDQLDPAKCPPLHPADLFPERQAVCSKAGDDGFMVTWLAAAKPSNQPGTDASIPLLMRRDHRTRTRQKKGNKISKMFRAVAKAKKDIKKKPAPTTPPCALRALTGKMCSACNRRIPCTCCLTKAGYIEGTKCQDEDEETGLPIPRTPPPPPPLQQPVVKSPTPCGWFTPTLDAIKCTNCNKCLKQTQDQQKPKSDLKIKTLPLPPPCDIKNSLDSDESDTKNQKQKQNLKIQSRHNTYSTFTLQSTSNDFSSISNISQTSTSTFTSLTSMSMNTTDSSTSTSDTESSIRTITPSYYTEANRKSVHFTYNACQEDNEGVNTTNILDKLKDFGSIFIQKKYPPVKIYEETYQPPCTCKNNNEPLNIPAPEPEPEVKPEVETKTKPCPFLFNNESNPKKSNDTEEEGPGCLCLGTVHGCIKCLSCNREVEDLINRSARLGDLPDRCECWPKCKVPDPMEKETSQEQDSKVPNSMTAEQNAKQQQQQRQRYKKTLKTATDDSENIPCMVEKPILDVVGQEQRDAMFVKDRIATHISQCIQTKYKRNRKQSKIGKALRFLKGIRGILADEAERRPTRAGIECLWKFGGVKICPSCRQVISCTCRSTNQGEVRGVSCKTHHHRILYDRDNFETIQDLSMEPVGGRTKPPPLPCGWLSMGKDSHKCEACNTEFEFNKKEIKFKSILRNEFIPDESQKVTVVGKAAPSSAQPIDAPTGQEANAKPSGQEANAKPSAGALKGAETPPPPPPCAWISVAPPDTVEPTVYPAPQDPDMLTSHLTKNVESRMPAICNWLPETQEQKKLPMYSTRRGLTPNQKDSSDDPELEPRLAPICKCRVTKKPLRISPNNSKNLLGTPLIPPCRRTPKSKVKASARVKPKKSDISVNEESNYSSDTKLRTLPPCRCAAKASKTPPPMTTTKRHATYTDDPESRLPLPCQCAPKERPKALELNHENRREHFSIDEQQDSQQNIASFDNIGKAPAIKKCLDCNNSLTRFFTSTDEDMTNQAEDFRTANYRNNQDLVSTNDVEEQCCSLNKGGSGIKTPSFTEYSNEKTKVKLSKALEERLAQEQPRIPPCRTCADKQKKSVNLPKSRNQVLRPENIRRYVISDGINTPPILPKKIHGWNSLTKLLMKNEADILNDVDFQSQDFASYSKPDEQHFSDAKINDNLTPILQPPCSCDKSKTDVTPMKAKNSRLFPPCGCSKNSKKKFSRKKKSIVIFEDGVMTPPLPARK